MPDLLRGSRQRLKPGGNPERVGRQPSGNLENRYACFDDFHNNLCNTDKLAPARISDRVSHGIAHADLEHLRAGAAL